MIMINSLFSTFDPSSSILNLSWVSVLIVLPISTNSINNSSSLLENFNIIPINAMNVELEPSLIKGVKGANVIFMSIFIIIATLNLISLYPQTFSITGQISVVLPIALSVWLSINLIGWSNNANNILIHLVPQGTPSSLINFIVLIELTSNIIRPITLSVRLVANIVAGHLLLCLLGGLITSLKAGGAPAIVVMIILTILEISVSIIQAYVFITLTNLYTNEIN